jgi:hypothetical protein
MLSVDFKKPFSYLTDIPFTALGAVASADANSLWWSILQKVRTFYEQNPDAD